MSDVSKYEVAGMASRVAEEYNKLHWWQFKKKRLFEEIIIWCYKTITR
jgi:hypothetical protein